MHAGLIVVRGLHAVYTLAPLRQNGEVNVTSNPNLDHYLVGNFSESKRVMSCADNQPFFFPS